MTPKQFQRKLSRLVSSIPCFSRYSYYFCSETNTLIIYPIYDSLVISRPVFDNLYKLEGISFFVRYSEFYNRLELVVYPQSACLL